MRAHVDQMPSSAAARVQRCHAAEDALQLLADRLQTYQPHYPAVDALGAVFAARATRGVQRRSSALSVDNARGWCVQTARGDVQCAEAVAGNGAEGRTWVRGRILES